MSNDLQKQLHAAIIENHVEAVRVLLSEGRVDQNAIEPDFGHTALIRASYLGQCEIATLLIEHGANVNAIDFDGRTALMWVSNIDIATLLLDHQADPNVSDRFGQTALMHSAIWTKCLSEKLQVASLLIEHGADVDSVDADGRSALIIASSKRRSELVNMLLHHGANPNLQDNAGVTALMKAGNQEICRLLLAQNADVFLKDKAGHTVIEHLARRPLLLKILQGAGREA